MTNKMNHAESTHLMPLYIKLLFLYHGDEEPKSELERVNKIFFVTSL
jgi:hypothetical protein